MAQLETLEGLPQTGAQLRAAVVDAAATSVVYAMVAVEDV